MEAYLKNLVTKDDLDKTQLKLEAKLTELMHQSEKMTQIIRLLEKQDEYLKQNMAILSQTMELMRDQFDSLRAVINKITLVQSKIDA